MSKINYFRNPAEQATIRIASRLKQEKVSRIARIAEVPERTAREYVEHPEKMKMQQGIALLIAADIPEREIAKLIKGV